MIRFREPHSWAIGPQALTFFESLDPSLTTFIVWGKNVEVMVVVKYL